MHIVLVTHSLNTVGGTETYLQVVADNLVRLGHRVTVHAPVLGPMSDVVAATGAAVVLADGLPEHCDGLVVNEASMAYAMAERYPGQPQVFVAHSPLFDIQIPPLLPVPGSVCVVMNERLRQRVEAMATGPDPIEVVRLRQPVDTVRLAPRGTPRPRPRRAVLLGNYLRGPALEAIEEAWGGAGVEIVRVGSLTSPTYDVATAVAEADIVVGKARAVLDGMACGRPAFVYDVFGGDGWVTPETYPHLEANGFAGYAEPDVLDVAALRSALDQYDAGTGHANRELVLKHHQDRRHAECLVELLTRIRPAGTEPEAVTPSAELARLTALRWKAERETIALRQQVADLTEQVRRLERQHAVVRRRARRRNREAKQAREALAALQQEREGRRWGR